MDENVKNDAKQVMLVQNADDGRLQAVTGVDRDGNIQTADPTDQNVASLLNVNTQDSAPRSLLQKFMEQAQNPRSHGYRFGHDGECPEQIFIRTSTSRPGDSGKLPYRPLRTASDAGAAAVRAAGRHEDRPGGYGEERYPHGGHRAHLKAMSYGHKSNGLVEMNPGTGERDACFHQRGARRSKSRRTACRCASCRITGSERPETTPLPRVLLEEAKKRNPDEQFVMPGKVIDLAWSRASFTPRYVSIDKWTNT